MLYRCPVLFGLPFSPMPRRAAQPLRCSSPVLVSSKTGWACPVALIHEAGMVLIPYVILVALAASRPAASVNAVSAIIGVNAAWTAASSLLLVSGWVAPTLLGFAFVLGQTFAVGAFGVIQYVCLRHAGSAATA
jgi:hypothetical protein